MAALLRMIEACLLVSMGTFMAVLSQSSRYWQFINPKYSWLTLVSGVILVVIGFGCLLNTKRRQKVSELLGIAVFLGLAVTAITSFDSMGVAGIQSLAPNPAETYSGAPKGSLTVEYDEADAATTITSGFQEYLKINVAELLQAEHDGKVAVGEAYAIQGAVVRSPELDSAGYIGVGRLLITCCFADSTAVVALVKVEVPDDYRAGSWVRALGTLAEGVPVKGKTITLTGALTGARSERFFLMADEVEERQIEGVPFVFEIRGASPFAY